MTSLGNIVTRSFALASLALFVGCSPPASGARTAAGGARSLTVPNVFPTREDLAKIAATPGKATRERDIAAVPEWHVDPTEASTPSAAEANLARVEPGLQIDEKLRCIAREFGRVRLEHGGTPDERTRRFIVGACGFTGTFVGAYVGTADVPANVTDTEVFARWKNAFALPPSFKGNSVGSWLSRKGGKAVLVTAAGKADSTLVVSPVDGEGRVRVTGTVPSNVEYVLALVNRGRERVATCDVDPSTALPRFSFTCSLATEDRWAWVEVLTRTTGRILSRSAHLALVRRDEKARIELPRIEGVPTSSTDIVASALESINRVRASLGAPPAVLAKEQSTTNDSLASRFFQAELGRDIDTSDRIALGLIAGWEVGGGTIRKGNFFDALLTGSSSTSSWMDYALDVPVGRFTLLDPTTRQIAIGAAPPADVGGLGLVVTAYSMFESADLTTAPGRFFERIDRARVARGLPHPKMLGALPHIQEAARLASTHQREPMAALDEGLASESERLRTSLRGYALLTYDLEAMPLDPALIESDALGIEVVEYKPPGSPWGAYLVFVVLTGQPTAPPRIAGL